MQLLPQAPHGYSLSWELLSIPEPSLNAPRALALGPQVILRFPLETGKWPHSQLYTIICQLVPKEVIPMLALTLCHLLNLNPSIHRWLKINWQHQVGGKSNSILFEFSYHLPKPQTPSSCSMHPSFSSCNMKPPGKHVVFGKGQVAQDLYPLSLPPFGSFKSSPTKREKKNGPHGWHFLPEVSQQIMNRAPLLTLSSWHWQYVRLGSVIYTKGN